MDSPRATQEGAGRLWLEVRGGDLFRVFLRLLGENDDPTHQPGLAEDLYSGSAMSFRIEGLLDAPPIVLRHKYRITALASNLDGLVGLRSFVQELIELRTRLSDRE
jgi:hypothetical protein